MMIRPAAPADNQSYGFTTNPAGQVTQKTDSNQVFSQPAKTAGALIYTANVLNEITAAGSASLVYDGHGNLASNGTVTYNYDALDGVLTSTAGGSLTYDPLGRLATATVAGGSPSQFVYDGNHAIAEYGGSAASSTATQHYVFGPGPDEPLAWYTNGSTNTPQYLAADYRGSIIAVTSSTGIVQSINYYDDYGAAPSGVSNTGRFQYTGQMWMAEVGLYHYKARAYSPALGRFLQNDPMGYGAGMNLYAYAGNDPINNIDPSGMHCGSAGGRDIDPGDCSSITGSFAEQTTYVDGKVDDVRLIFYPGDSSGATGFGGSPFNLGSGGGSGGGSGSGGGYSPGDQMIGSFIGVTAKYTGYALLSGLGGVLEGAAYTAARYGAAEGVAADLALVEHMNNMNICSGTDCSEIADSLLNAANGAGSVVRITPAPGQTLNLMEYGSLEDGFVYHEVYTDGAFAYDPRFSPSATPYSSYLNSLMKLNPGATVAPR